MPNIGFWATAGAGAGAAGAYELISTATGGAGSIDFTSIPQTYKHLQLRMVLRTDYYATNIATFLRLNGSTSSHTAHYLDADGDSGLWSYYNTGAGIPMQYFPGSGNTANVYGVAIVDITDYASTAKTKTVKTSIGFAQSSTVYKVGLQSGFLPSSSAAITSITLYGNTFSYTGASRVSLYGIKG